MTTEAQVVMTDELRQCLDQAFKEVDTDGSGFIDAAEAERVLKSVYNDPNFKGRKPADDEQVKKEASDLIALLDQNSDNKVSLSEFTNFFEKLLSTVTGETAAPAATEEQPAA